MSINFNISLRETDKQISQKITQEVARHLNQKFPLAIPQIQAVVRNEIFNALLKQPEYTALRNGDLKVELGLIDGTNRLLSIIDIWLGTIKAEFTPFKRVGERLSQAGIKVFGIRSDYSDVLDDQEANFVTEKGENLPWLRWLLLEGTTVIIANYSFRAGVGIGRTGGGIMVERGSWGIPLEYSGGTNQNFITRAIETIQESLETQITQIIKGKI